MQVAAALDWSGPSDGRPRPPRMVLHRSGWRIRSWPRLIRGGEESPQGGLKILAVSVSAIINGAWATTAGSTSAAPRSRRWWSTTSTTCSARRGGRRPRAAVPRMSRRSWRPRSRDAASGGAVAAPQLDGDWRRLARARSKTGASASARNLPGWEGTFPLGRRSAEHARVRRSKLGNDVQVATDAEFKLGAGRLYELAAGRLLGNGRGRRADPRRQALDRARRRRGDRPHGRGDRRRALHLRAARLHGGLRRPRRDGSARAQAARGEGHARPTCSS